MNSSLAGQSASGQMDRPYLMLCIDILLLALSGHGHIRSEEAQSLDCRGKKAYARTAKQQKLLPRYVFTVQIVRQYY